MGYRKIVIVGENNLCRSFIAESILRGLLNKKNISNIEVISRGLVVMFSEPVSPVAERLLRHHGYKIEEFRSSPLTEKDLESADLVLTMTRAQAEQVRKDYATQAACMSVGTFIDMDEDIRSPEEGIEQAEDENEVLETFFHSVEQSMEAVADRIIGELSPVSEILS